ncbi:MAG: class I SAM-dependent methyltransferase [Bryobacteraceae bacterium]
MTDTQAEMQSAGAQAELKEIYSLRFAGVHGYRTRVWRILALDFFSKWIRPQDSVLDLGCGHGEFINHAAAEHKFAMDLNPATKDCLAGGIHFFEQESSARWPLAGGALDAVFTSNFFEHLPSKAALRTTLREACRCLKPNGCLVAMGPNVKAISGPYWDFFDHYLPLTERSLAEALRLEGFRIELAIPRFLPYTMSLGFHPPLWTVRLYLKMPFVWRIFGRQFLVVGRKI